MMGGDPRVVGGLVRALCDPRRLSSELYTYNYILES
jgi:hypothetical protein